MGLFPAIKASLFIHGRDTDRTGGRAVGGTPTAAGETPALVRLRGQGDRAVKVRLCAVMNRAVSNRNCVGAIRGGEQRNENDQSVTQASPDGTSQ